MRSTQNATGIIAAAAAAVFASGAAVAGNDAVTFSDGQAGWTGTQGVGGVGTYIDVEDGSPAPALRTVFNDFGITYRNTSNLDFVRDLSIEAGFTFSIDTKVNDIRFTTTPVSRPWLLELRDFTAGANGDQYASVWFKFADVDATAHGEWTTFSAQVNEFQYGDLPRGWRGAGAEDPVTFEPMLPEGITFADVISGYDEIVVTTYEPGFFFGFTDFDVLVDNISLRVGTDIMGCNDADLAEPFGVLDLADVQAFVGAFIANEPAADIAEPFGVFDLSDVQTFVGAFVAGCP